MIRLLCFLFVTVVALLLTVCLCVPQAPRKESSDLAIRPSGGISEEEADVLLTFYDSLPAQLTPRQQELVESYRALRAYLVNERPGVSFCVELLEPGSSLSPTGNSYDTFHILWPDASKGKYSVRKRQDGTLEIRNLGGIP